jgi:uncharacterized OB-fold protein
VSARPDGLPPYATAETQPFWEGCRVGELRLQRCDACDAWQFYPRAFCVACSATGLRWERASGRGAVRSWSVVRRAVDPEWAAVVPYALALVALDEGPTLMGVVVGCAPDAVRIGTRVHVEFAPGPGGPLLPRFRAD